MRDEQATVRIAVRSTGSSEPTPTMARVGAGRFTLQKIISLAEPWGRQGWMSFRDPRTTAGHHDHQVARPACHDENGR
jgi:hypothetical protein